MAEILKKSNCWENPPIPVLSKVLADNDAVPHLLQESISAEDPRDIASDVSQLTSAGILEEYWKKHTSTSTERPVQSPNSIKKMVFQETSRDFIANV